MKKRNKFTVQFDKEKYIDEKNALENQPEDVKLNLNKVKLYMAFCLPLGIVIGCFFDLIYSAVISVSLAVAIFSVFMLVKNQNIKLSLVPCISLILGTVLGQFVF